MSVGRKYIAFLYYFIADFTYNFVRNTAFGAGCGFSVDNFFGMPFKGKLTALCQRFTAYGAYYAVGFAVFLTGGRSTFDGLFFMTGSFNYVVRVVVSALTFVIRVAVFRASGINGCQRILML